jgi:hypothetical protein
VDLLPQPIQRYIVNGSKALGCDAAFIAVPMLSVLASAIGNSKSIQLKESWQEPSVLWTAVIGESGSMKTPAIRFAMKPLQKIQSEAFKEHDKEMEVYNELKSVYDQEMWMKKRNDPLPEEPKEPVATRFYCNDATIEAIAEILSTCPRGILQSCDELSGWFKSFNSYRGGKGSDEARWLEMHQADTLLVDRKSGNPKTIRIPQAAVSICGGIQPDILRRVLGREYYENGIAARFLLAKPPRHPKIWTEIDVDADLVKEVEDVFRKLIEMEIVEDDTDGFTTKPLPLTSAGQDLWVAFYNEHAAEQNELTGDLAAVWSKLEAAAARLALVIHCVRVAAGDTDLESEGFIDEDSIARGVGIVSWFKYEQKRLYAAMAEDEHQSEQKQLIEVISRQGGKISIRDLQRSSRTYQGSSGTAEKALQKLVDGGCGQWEQRQAGTSGGRPSKVFVLKKSGSDDKTLSSVA